MSSGGENEDEFKGFTFEASIVGSDTINKQQQRPWEMQESMDTHSPNNILYY